jgi:hypothetical protein
MVKRREELETEAIILARMIVKDGADTAYAVGERLAELVLALYQRAPKAKRPQ